jgi:pimeloyl-ACP methyl ester carboxylesterase
MASNETTRVQEVRYLTRPGGRVAYEVAGTGPLVLLVMGDLRSTYRFLVPAIVDAGFRVAWTDLRGHRDSDATFASYGDLDTAGEIIALVEELGGPAAVVGNSMGAGSAVLAAADRNTAMAEPFIIGRFATS